VEAVCNEDLDSGLEALLSSLLDKSSLLRTDSGRDAQPRFGMLDIVREFAAERAAERENRAPTDQRHARYFLDYCEHATEQAARTDRREWLDRLAQERGNIRLAFERLLRGGATEEALRVAIAFARALPWDAHAYEVRGWLAQGLAAPQPPPAALRATALYCDGMLALSQNLLDEARRQLEAARSAASGAGEPAIEAAALAALGRRAVLVDAPEAAALCDAAVAAARNVGDPILIADALLMAAGACERAAAWERADELAGDALVLYREAGEPYGAAAALAEQGWYAMVHGRLDESEQYLGEALELRRRHGDDRRLVETLIDYAWLMLAGARAERARHGFLDCLARRPRRRPIQRRRGACRPLDTRHRRVSLGRGRAAGRSIGCIAQPDRRPCMAVSDRHPRPCPRRGPRGARRGTVRGLLRRGRAAVRRARRSPRREPAGASVVPGH
jgi:tetratricopeptide (TPR) repeat protein